MHRFHGHYISEFIVYFGYHDSLKIYGAPKLLFTVSNPPVVLPKSSCEVHLLRRPLVRLGFKGDLISPTISE